MTQLPILVSIVNIIKTLRTEGSLSPEDLMSKAGSSRKTFYRAIDALKESGVVVTKEGKYYWYESLDTRSYDTEFEAKLALDHSVNVASGLKHLIESRQASFIDIKRMSNHEYLQQALTHLRTGYDRIFAMFEKSEDTRRQTDAKEQELEKQIATGIRSSSLQTGYPENFVKIIISDMKEVFRGRQPYFLNDLQVQGEDVKSGAYASLGKKEQFDPLKRFIIEQETLTKNQEICSEIVKLENRYFDLRQKFIEEIDFLIMLVENGTTLKGNCELCPKIKIASRGTQTSSTGSQKDQIQKDK